ncbi:aldehyde dehydrogenase family protein [Methanoculleus sp. 7T]|jgi:betaine-aldehyde dehydrogenase|uniref:aldehyde dehydrogenase family protein n=1 Tax=Methanoculleus sp. 7T TaxID=2937282 RepID=UPI0020BEC6AE|nr:aldehyde dehydrogenase family protein [Methanoculleus sp. 7T]MCK8519589.1 aldehyde dehydrogenase family protein [Methanoculleus sp. 7T]
MKLLINGERRDSVSGKVFTVRNPATGDVVGEAPLGGEDDVRHAVEAAGEAFADWSAKNPRDRAKILFFAAEEVRRRNTELGSLLTAEQGKPIREAVDEINGFANILEYYYALSAGERGEYLNLRGYGRTLVRRRPLGICGAIIPWNMPAIIMGWKIGPALTAGNTLVLKPAGTAPLTCGKLAEILEGAGLPPGVLNVVTGPGETVGREIARNPGIRKVSFTGEVGTGRQVAMDAAPALKRLTLELGGSDPMIVCDDADIPMAVEGVIRGRFYNCGQTCTAVKRLYVYESIADEFIRRLTARVEGIVVGNGMERGVTMGPLNNQAGLERVVRQVDTARERGEGEIIAGGLAPRGENYEHGFFFLPTLIAGVPHDSVLFSEEVFGPVLPIATVTGLDEALERANDSRYGLGASVWTRSADVVVRATEELEAGIVWVNQHLRTPPEVPFGGTKESGIGRENGSRALDEYTEEKSVLIRL